MAKKPKASVPPMPEFLAAADKRTTIMRAALTLFLRDGYSETSMDAVTEEAGVSKATVYAHFASKQVLFETLMREGAGAAFDKFPPLARGDGPPEAELSAFFERVLQHILADGAYAWDRLVIAEAVRHPENARLFHRCAIERLQTLVEGYLVRLGREGLIADVEHRRAAEALLAMVLLGPLHTVLLLGPETSHSGEALRFRLRLFLNGLAVR